MKEIVEKREVEELLGCEITDEQFEQALKYARHKQEYIYQREQREVVLQHWYLVKLTEEYVRSLAFSKFTMDLWYHPQEAFALMDDLTVSVVKNLGWNRLCQSENPTADRANFREAYEAKAREAVNSNMLPDFISNEKLMLQQQYAPRIEAREPPAIEQTVAPERKELTPQQREERARQFEAVRRRLMGGGTNE